jgi:hypothetical protein
MVLLVFDKRILSESYDTLFGLWSFFAKIDVLSL